MTLTRKILGFSLGLLLSLIIYGGLIFIAIFFFQLHLGYFPIMDDKDYFMVFGFILSMSLLIVGLYIVIKKRFRYFAIGTLSILLFLLFALTIYIPDYYKFKRTVDFNKEVWKSTYDKPVDLVFSLIRTEKLKEMTKSEVLDLLGNDLVTDYSSDNILTYHIAGSRITYFQVTIDSTGLVDKVYYTYYD